MSGNDFVSFNFDNDGNDLYKLDADDDDGGVRPMDMSDDVDLSQHSEAPDSALIDNDPLHNILTYCHNVDDMPKFDPRAPQPDSGNGSNFATQDEIRRRTFVVAKRTPKP